MKINFKKNIQLFVQMFILSSFTFGGGYVIISLMRTRFVEKLKWISEEELLNYTAIAQTCPGAVAVNASILVGYRISGAVGVLFSVFGTVLPPLILLSVLSYCYAIVQDNQIIGWMLKGMQAGVVAVVLDVTTMLVIPYFKAKQYFLIALMILTFVLVALLNVNVIFVILGGLTVGLIYNLICKLSKGGNQ